MVEHLLHVVVFLQTADGLIMERLSWTQIRTAHPNEWVLLIDLDADDETDEVRAAQVLDHSPDKALLVSRSKKAVVGRSAALLYTGEVGKGRLLF